MPLTEKERNTQTSYEVSAEEWLEHSGGRKRDSYWTEGLTGLSQELGGKGKILEVGCGPATDGKYLSDMGFSVVSTDYTEAMPGIAREINPMGVYSVTEMQELSFAENSFDGFWATACLLHLENPDSALSELVRVTKRGGVGFISIKEGDGEYIDPRTGYYFRYHQDQDFIRKMQDLGLETISSRRKTGSSNHDWLTYLVRVIK